MSGKLKFLIRTRGVDLKAFLSSAKNNSSVDTMTRHFISKLQIQMWKTAVEEQRGTLPLWTVAPHPSDVPCSVCWFWSLSSWSLALPRGCILTAREGVLLALPTPHQPPLKGLPGAGGSLGCFSGLNTEKNPCLSRSPTLLHNVYAPELIASAILWETEHRTLDLLLKIIVIERDYVLTPSSHFHWKYTWEKQNLFSFSLSLSSFFHIFSSKCCLKIWGKLLPVHKTVFYSCSVICIVIALCRSLVSEVWTMTQTEI